jgi:raffinose/stachyose/melibiose transport system permease protein
MTTMRHSPATTARTAVTYVLLTLFLIIAVFPFLVLLLAAFKTDAEIARGALSLPATLRLDNFARAWREANFNYYFRSSAYVAVVVVAASVVLSVLTGYAFGTMRFPGSRVLFVLFLLGLMVPFEAVVIPLYYRLRAVGLTDHYAALILPQIGLSVSFGTFWMRGFFRNAPAELIDAALIDGAGSLRVLRSVLLPLARPAILTLVVLLFMWTWNEFLLALVLVQKETLRTLPVGLAFFQGQHTADIPLLAAGSVIVSAPILIIYIIFQRHFIQGMTSGAIRG